MPDTPKPDPIEKLAEVPTLPVPEAAVERSPAGQAERRPASPRTVEIDQAVVDYLHKSYQYIRLGMVAMVILIAVAVAYQIFFIDDGEILTSISAYYYTPARAAFASSIVAIAACLIALKGARGGEDVLLNTAGLMAPVVALVPTPNFDKSKWCQPSDDAAAGFDCTEFDSAVWADVTNNFTSLLVLGWGILVVVGFKLRERLKDGDLRAGLLTYCAVLVGYTVAFLVFRPIFNQFAHWVSAVSMFVFIGLVVLLNAERLSVHWNRWNGRNLLTGFIQLIGILSPGGTPRTDVQDARRYFLAYLWVARLMCIAPLAVLLVPGDSYVFWLEVAEISLFACFWVAQTFEQKSSVLVNNERIDVPAASGNKSASTGAAGAEG